MTRKTPSGTIKQGRCHQGLYDIMIQGKLSNIHHQKEETITIRLGRIVRYYKTRKTVSDKEN